MKFDKKNEASIDLQESNSQKYSFGFGLQNSLKNKPKDYQNDIKIEPSKFFKIFKKPVNLFLLSSAFVFLISVSFFIFSSLSKPKSSDIAGKKSVLSSNEFTSSSPGEQSNSLQNISSSAQSQDISNFASSQAATQNTSSIIAQQTQSINSYKTFSGEDFKNFYDSFQYSKVDKITAKPIIRGNSQADIKIQSIAENRGYKLRYEAQCKCLQTETMQAFIGLQTEAKKSGLNLVLVSGFRSVNDQRNIFNAEISGLSNSEIISGSADNKINSILITRSIPGYSRHHTGYTIDLGCNSQNLVNFKNTPCYEWISENNYENVKKFGFIPSYPVGAINQGPDPEQWEYVWVGQESLKN
jgi:LAS superfamily LD-carboxypeptidase LdcB